MLVTDGNLLNMKPVQHARQSLEAAGVRYTVFSDVRVEPNDTSIKAAIAFAKAHKFDAYLAVGGGSVMDTAKAANLYATFPGAEFLDFVNAPVGKGLPVPGPVQPLIAVPTTSGTGSETTGVSIFDYEPLGAKTGIASRVIRPTLGVIDPENTSSMPWQVKVASGFDVFCHALESYTALPYNQRTPRPARPHLRPAYQGSNPISDVWSLSALESCRKYFVRSVENPDDFEAQEAMALAAAAAGVGFGNAGVHLCHGMSYPVAGLVKGTKYHHPGYKTDHPIVPHGISVVVNAPAVFRYTAATNPERHLHAASILGADVSRVKEADAGKVLSDVILKYMERLKVPDGLAAFGYKEADIDAMVQGTLPQKRVLAVAPRTSTGDDLHKLFEDSFRVYK